MDAYTSFASVYDLFMDNVPYEEWCAFLCKILAQHGITDGPVLDLGCCTGKMTRLMSEQGYDMTGPLAGRLCRNIQKWHRVRYAP